LHDDTIMEVRHGYRSVGWDENLDLRTIVTLPPDGLPVYRVLTGPDDDAFCRRVSGALAQGYRLHAGPALAVKGEATIVAQALVWQGSAPTGAALPQ
jgi:hypothetical protein